jgi:hypothetical protein
VSAGFIEKRLEYPNRIWDFEFFAKIKIPPESGSIYCIFARRLALFGVDS